MMEGDVGRSRLEVRVALARILLMRPRIDAAGRADNHLDG
jgi:hypothetical protein